ncbi:MAG: ribosome maturation factor RimP [Candidatus Thiothrix sulfatifontis]|nr:MAG: ribosome maturation factor RimP [Candidatus Thiothrix sulfatifontis]
MQERLDTLIHTTVTGLGYDLWGYEYRPQTESALLRIFIDAEQGITVEDCGRVSNQLSASLDVEDLIPVAYILEVSSPGIDRVLFIPAHYALYVGQQIKVRTRLPVEKRRNFVGKLQDANDTHIFMEVDSTVFEIPYEIIDRGRVVLDIRPQRKGGKHA